MLSPSINKLKKVNNRKIGRNNYLKIIINYYKIIIIFTFKNTNSLSKRLLILKRSKIYSFILITLIRTFQKFRIKIISDKVKTFHPNLTILLLHGWKKFGIRASKSWRNLRASTRIREVSVKREMHRSIASLTACTAAAAYVWADLAGDLGGVHSTVCGTPGPQGAAYYRCGINFNFARVHHLRCRSRRPRASSWDYLANRTSLAALPHTRASYMFIQHICTRV